MLFFPKSLCTAVVMPLRKCGPIMEPGNYRAISLTNQICKAMKHILTHLIINITNLIRLNHKNVASSKEDHAGWTLLIERFIQAVDSRHAIHAAYYNLAKAFNIIGHNEVAEKLLSLNKSPSVVRWKVRWLKDRSYKVCVAGAFSNHAKVTSGVFQGSLLGSLLFGIYFYDFKNDYQDIWLAKCADKCNLCKSANPPQISIPYRISLINT